MGVFSKGSYEKLQTCDPRLVVIFEEVVKHFDCTVVCGHRGEAEQESSYIMGKSEKQWPDSKHNKMPSLAVDVVPYPIDWNDYKRMYYFGGYVKRVAEEHGIALRWGGDWDSDTQVLDQKFNDLPHFELVEANPNG